MGLSQCRPTLDYFIAAVSILVRLSRNPLVQGILKAQCPVLVEWVRVRVLGPDVVIKGILDVAALAEQNTTGNSTRHDNKAGDTAYHGHRLCASVVLGQVTRNVHGLGQILVVRALVKGLAAGTRVG